MELTVLNKLQEQISTNRQRRERTTRRLGSSSNAGQDRLVVTRVKRTYTSVETPEQILQRLFSESGWNVRSHFNDPNFRVPALENRTVAFSLRDENDELQKYSGVLQAASRAGTALFRLAGTDKVFNANLVGFMAVQP